ncbi:MAG: hypothetical protein IAB08_07005, partial [Bacteroidetes bacterium]|nr:hypothetical protein [Candidatus Pullibacteroides excrementavium]
TGVAGRSGLDGLPDGMHAVGGAGVEVGQEGDAQCQQQGQSPQVLVHRVLSFGFAL